MFESFYWFFEIFLFDACFRFESCAREPPMVRLSVNMAAGKGAQADGCQASHRKLDSGVRTFLSAVFLVDVLTLYRASPAVPAC
jgi:hypothetical protein